MADNTTNSNKPNNEPDKGEELKDSIYQDPSYAGRYGDSVEGDDVWNIEVPDESGTKSKDSTPEEPLEEVNANAKILSDPDSETESETKELDSAPEQSTLDAITATTKNSTRYSAPSNDDTDSGFFDKVFSNSGNDPVINYNFMLRVEAAYDLPCKAIKGIRRENEFEYIQEGGLNDYVHMKRKPISKPFTFQVERYVGMDMFDPLALGTELVLPVMLFVTRYSIDFKPPRTYMFTGCVVTAKDYGDLDAEKSGLLVETTTIAYRQMVCVDVPNYLLKSDEYSIRNASLTGRSTTGRNFRYAASNTTWEDSTMYSKANMESNAIAHKFDISKDYGLDENGQLKHLGGVKNGAGSNASSKKSKQTMTNDAAGELYDINAQASINPLSGQLSNNSRIKPAIGFKNRSIFTKDYMEKRAIADKYNINNNIEIDPSTGQPKVNARVRTPMVGATAASRRSKADMVTNSDRKVFRIYKDNAVDPTTGQLKVSSQVKNVPSATKQSRVSKASMIASAEKAKYVLPRGKEIAKDRTIAKKDTLSTKSKPVKFSMTTRKGLDLRVRGRLDNKSTKGTPIKFYISNTKGLDKRVGGRIDTLSKKGTPVVFKLTNTKGLDKLVRAKKDTKSTFSKSLMETMADANKYKITDGKGLDKRVAAKEDKRSTHKDGVRFVLTKNGPSKRVRAKEDNASTHKDGVKFVFTKKGPAVRVRAREDKLSKKLNGRRFKLTTSKNIDTAVASTRGFNGKKTKAQMEKIASDNLFPKKRSARDINKYLSKKN